MILKETSNREVSGNLGGETIKMGISDIRLIIDRLTDLYSDRELACIREYATNALDAHIEAGVTTPIDVTTPGPLAPFLSIRDYGIGLTVEDIREIYSQYGASTKRNTNTQTGALGLGCKSALSYTDQFTVTSVKDGVRIQVVVSRDPKEGATMKVVDSSSTNEANGTTIMIPARGHNEIERKCKNFFRFWEAGTVRLNGAEPEKLPGAKWISDNLAIIDEYNSNKIVMGGVPYPAPNLSVNLDYGQSLIAFVPIGAVDFVPSREGLMDTPDTTATLARIRDEYKTKLHEAIRKDIEDAPNPAEAIRRRLDWGKRLPNSMVPPDLKYKGADLPADQSYPVGSLYASTRYGRMSDHTVLKVGVPIRSALNALHVHGFDYASFTATVRKKIQEYIEDNLQGENFDGYVLIPTAMSAVDTKWLSDIKTVDWPTIKAIKLPRASNANKLASGRIPGSYDIFENGDFNEGVPGDDIDTSHPIFYMRGSRYGTGVRAAEWLKKSYPNGFTLVMLSENRIEKFKRLFPAATDVADVQHKAYKAWTAKIDKKQARALAVKNTHDTRFDLLPLDELDDPDIAAVAKILKTDTTKLSAEIKEWEQIGYFFYPEDDSDLANPMDKYVLLPEGYYFRQHQRNDKKFIEKVVRYMNCEYKHLKEEGK